MKYNEIAERVKNLVKENKKNEKRVNLEIQTKNISQAFLMQ